MKPFNAKHTWIIVIALGLVFGCARVLLASAAEQPDVIYFDGKIVTLDAAESTASAVAVKDGKFLKVGSSDEIKQLAGPSTQLVDLGGKTVVPGLIDAHCHPMEAMMMKETWVDCRFPETSSVKEALEHIAAWAKKTPKGEWIFAACVSASENKFAEKRLPNKAELDIAAPDNPMMLANGTHMGIANSAALERLGIKKGVEKLPHGGSVILDKDGEPTGVLTDAQADVPTTPTVVELEQYYSKDIQEFWNQHGFTSVLAITPAAALPVLQKIAGAKIKPTIRYTTSIWTSANGKDMPEDLGSFRMPETADPAWYRFGGIKVWVDGENDCRTGYMYAPYVGHFDTDPPGGKGTLVTPQADADRFADIANKSGVISMMHCSGDAATDIGLNAYEKEMQSPAPETINRIEHFGMFQLTDKQLQQAKELKKKNFYISVQPTWLLDLVKADYENMGPERTRTGFKFRSMIDAGLEPAAGTDVTGIYLDNVNPFLAIYGSVTRDSDDGLFMPEEAISVPEALKMWTIWAAKSMGESDTKGSIEPGKYADMVVLSDDIFTMPKEHLKDVKVVKTIVGGDAVYEAKQTGTTGKK
ncbi:MAG: amidohydrolase [Candidatus Omnitrophica bacterium]|nr:amidohydrolase [Candidatus Omnitrophota bacterium]